MSLETASQRFPLAPSEEGGYLLAIAAAVAAAGSKEAVITTSSNEVSASFDYVEYHPRLTADLVSGDLKARTWAERMFAISCRAGLLAGAPRVDFESWNGRIGVRWRITPEGVKEESLSKTPWKGGASGSRLIVRFRTGLSRELFRVSGSGDQTAVNRLAERARHSGVRLVVDNKPLNQDVKLGEGLLELVFAPSSGAMAKRSLAKVTCQAQLKRESESRGDYYAHFVFGGEEGESRVICRGLTFPVALPLADEQKK